MDRRVPGNITLQPGSPISIRGAIPSSESQGGSYTLVPSSMTGTLFAFAFIGALVIGFVAGALFMKYSRFGRRKEHNKAQGDLTEQLRLLTDTLGNRNDSLDREEKYIQAAANQADFVPPWYHSRQHSAMYPDRLHPQSVPDQTYYQDWATPFGGSSSLVPSSLRQPRVINLPPTQLPPDVEIGGPKGEWLNSNSNTGSTTGSSSVNASYSDLNEFERRRPQIQEEGQGEDSLFNIGATPSHNPHVISIVD
ncbi:hypothetical protein BGX29_006190 [Mortierella sp. GBA35]|nr:hypothetical protein BGX29_006190 [Mortierella sp. GBA35]